MFWNHADKAASRSGDQDSIGGIGKEVDCDWGLDMVSTKLGSRIEYYRFEVVSGLPIRAPSLSIYSTCFMTFGVIPFSLRSRLVSSLERNGASLPRFDLRLILEY